MSPLFSVLETRSSDVVVKAAILWAGRTNYLDGGVTVQKRSSIIRSTMQDGFVVRVLSAKSSRRGFASEPARQAYVYGLLVLTLTRTSTHHRSERVHIVLTAINPKKNERSERGWEMEMARARGRPSLPPAPEYLLCIECFKFPVHFSFTCCGRIFQRRQPTGRGGR